MFSISSVVVRLWYICGIKHLLAWIEREGPEDPQLLVVTRHVHHTPFGLRIHPRIYYTSTSWAG